jgi:DNA end-binding protein Ku
VPDKTVEIKPAELKMAGQVVESIAEDFNPDRYHHTYQEQLRELVEAKLEGGEAFTAGEQPTELDETEDVSDLLAKLEASVKARSQASKSPAKEAPGKRPRPKRRPRRPHPKGPARRREPSDHRHGESLSAAHSPSEDPSCRSAAACTWAIGSAVTAA